MILINIEMFSFNCSLGLVEGLTNNPHTCNGNICFGGTVYFVYLQYNTRVNYVLSCLANVHRKKRQFQTIRTISMDCKTPRPRTAKYES